MRTSYRSVLALAPATLIVLVSCGSSDDGGGGDGTPPGLSPPPGGTTESTTDPLPPGSNGTCPHDLSKLPGVATNGLTIPIGHPRLWWTPDRVARAKTWLASHPQDPRDDDYMGQLFLHAVSGADCSKAISWAMAYTVDDSDFTTASEGRERAGVESDRS